MTLTFWIMTKRRLHNKTYQAKQRDSQPKTENWEWQGRGREDEDAWQLKSSARWQRLGNGTQVLPSGSHWAAIQTLMNNVKVLSSAFHCNIIRTKHKAQKSKPEERGQSEVIPATGNWRPKWKGTTRCQVAIITEVQFQAKSAADQQQFLCVSGSEGAVSKEQQQSKLQCHQQ